VEVEVDVMVIVFGTVCVATPVVVEVCPAVVVRIPVVVAVAVAIAVTVTLIVPGGERSVLASIPAEVSGGRAPGELPTPASSVQAGPSAVKKTTTPIDRA
jgi:hypothetical protein